MEEEKLQEIMRDLKIFGEFDMKFDDKYLTGVQAHVHFSSLAGHGVLRGEYKGIWSNAFNQNNL